MSGQLADNRKISIKLKMRIVLGHYLYINESLPLTNKRYINGWVASLPLTDKRYINGRVESVVLRRKAEDFCIVEICK